MPANYVLLEKITVGAAGASSVTFSGIPQTGYTDLVLLMSCRQDGAGSNVRYSINGTTTGYSERLLYGSGSATGSATNSTSYFNFVYTNGSGETANLFGNLQIYIPNYAGSQNKSISVDSVYENNSAGATQALTAQLWSNTAAITSITITPATTNWIQYSTFYLYGVAKLGTTPVIVPYATGGDTIMTDGTYWYHAFRSSGTFTPAKGLSCDILAVAGGGGGGFNIAGAGGAGGLFYSTNNSVSTIGYTVTVGAGGAAGVANARGSNGSNSVFGALTAAVGGGGGGSDNAFTGSNGGSGGGASSGSNGQAGGTGTSGQGSNGGASYQVGNSYSGGGGGGAGAVGAAGTDNQGGAGGAGVNTYSTWLNTTGTGVSGFIAGGGGGSGMNIGSGSSLGAGGSGGGGNGGLSNGSGNPGTAATAGIANTGGGGGGGAWAASSPNNATGGVGGSGLVIVRYLV